MPIGPKGEKRPADPIANAVLVVKIATGEAEDECVSQRRKGGLAGGKARAASMSPERRREIAKRAANARWAIGKSTR